MAMMLEGFISKKTAGLISVYQRKYFQVVANGAYLAYYNKEPNRLSKNVTVPNGVF